MKDRSIACPECGEAFKTLEAFDYHRFNQHGLPPYGMPSPRKSFRVKGLEDEPFNCPDCGEDFYGKQVFFEHWFNEHGHPICTLPSEAKREDSGLRYDLLIPEFIKEMARLAAIGAAKYGDKNWRLSRLEGDKSPVNHAMAHLISYQMGESSDEFEAHQGHLVSVAFNAMMEWWYEKNFKEKEVQNDPTGTNSSGGSLPNE